jgi:O-antigen/teichoic acid export membrane protein
MAVEGEGAPAPGGNLYALGLIQVFRLISGFVINVLVMRGLGVEGFGIYGYVLTLVGLASFGSGLGMERLLKREIARDPGTAGHYVATGLWASALLAIVTGLGIVAWTAAADGRGIVVAAATLASLAVGIQALTIVPVSAFHAVRRMSLGVGPNAVGRLVLVVSTALFLWLRLGVMSVFAAQILDGLATMVVVAWVYLRTIGLGGLRTTWPDVRRLVRDSVPFGLNALFVSIYLSVDVLLLGLLRDDHEVGVYRGAVMLLSLFPIVADTLSTGLYPRMARHLGQPERAAEEMRLASRVLLAVSLPAAVGGVLTAPALMVFLGGSEWAVSALPFQIMAPLLPLRYLNNAFGMVLSALDRQQDRTNGAILAAIVNIGLNLLVIPRWGALGAAVTTFATELVLIVFMARRALPLMAPLRLGQTLLRVGPPTVLMGLAVALASPFHVLVQIAVGVGVYLVAGRATGALQVRDLRALRGV